MPLFGAAKNPYGGMPATSSERPQWRIETILKNPNDVGKTPCASGPRRALRCPTAIVPPPLSHRHRPTAIGASGLPMWRFLIRTFRNTTKPPRRAQPSVRDGTPRQHGFIDRPVETGIVNTTTKDRQNVPCICVSERRRLTDCSEEEF